MSGWQPKRFWTQAHVESLASGYTVRLDQRTIKTPAKSDMVLPTKAMADAVAAEWDAQVETVDPGQMPVTRSANAAIDKVARQRDEVITLLAEYGDSDLLCYRADRPEGLVEQQMDAWNPLLDWAEQALGVRLRAAEGVMHVPQDPEALRRLRLELDGFDNFALAAMHDLISLSGSLIIALAVGHGRLSPEEAWSTSRIDEAWQISQWGDDEEASVAAGLKRASFLDAARFYQLSLT